MFPSLLGLLSTFSDSSLFFHYYTISLMPFSLADAPCVIFHLSSLVYLAASKIGVWRHLLILTRQNYIANSVVPLLLRRSCISIRRVASFSLVYFKEGLPNCLDRG